MGTIAEFTNGTGAAGLVNPTTRAGQEFLTPGYATETNAVMLQLMRSGTPTDNYIAELWSMSGPGGTPVELLRTSRPLAIATVVTGNPTLFGPFVFDVPLSLAASTTYLVALRRESVTDSGNYISIGSNTASGYANGRSYSHNGTAWNIGSAVTDYGFRILETIVPSFSTSIPMVGPFKTSNGPPLAQSVVTTASFQIGYTTTGSQWAGQTFTPATGFTLTAISLWLSRITPAPTYGILITIRSLSPTGTILATSDTVAPATVGSAKSYIRFEFPSGFTFQAGVTYAIRVQTVSLQAGYGYNAGGSNTDVFPGEGSNDNGETGGDLGFVMHGASTDMYYAAGVDDNGTTIRFIKSSDPTAGWTTTASVPLGVPCTSLSAYQQGDTVHFVYGYSNAGNAFLAYQSLDMTLGGLSGNAETILNGVITTGQLGALQHSASVVVRSNGEVVVLHNGVQTKTSGTYRARVYHTRRTAVNTWSAPVQCDSNTAGDFVVRESVLGAGDVVHLFWFNQTIGQGLSRTLSAANALSTVVDCGSVGTSTYDYAADALVEGANTRVAYAYGNSTSNNIGRFLSAAAPSFTTGSQLPAGAAQPARLRHDGTDFWVFFRNSAGSAVNVAKSVNYGQTWDSPATSLVAAVPASRASLSRDGAIYQYGSSIVIPYFVVDGSTWRYNQHVARYIAQADAWNVNDKSTGVTLSNGDKTATTSNGSQYLRSTQGNPSATAAKLYAEFKKELGTSSLTVGFADGDSTLANAAALAATLNINHLSQNGGKIFINSVDTGVNIGTFANGDVACGAWDTSAKLVWFRKNGGLWNNSATADPATGVGGISFPTPPTNSKLLGVIINSGDSLSVRTEVADYTLAPPIGFKSWMGEIIPTAGAWNVSDKDASLSLSGSDKIVTSSVTQSQAIRSTRTIPLGAAEKYYAEYLQDNYVTDHAFGIKQTGNALNIINNGCAILSQMGNVLVDNVSQGSFSGSPSALVDGDIYSVAWNVPAKLIWFRKNALNWNNNASANPATGVGGYSTAAFPAANYALFAQLSGVASKGTLRTEKAEFTLPTPVGFLSWMGETLVIPDMGTLTCGAASVSGVGAATHHGTGTLTAQSVSLVNPGGISGSTGTGALTALWTAPVSANTILNSEEFDNAAWSKTNATVTANAVTAPNSTLTADQIFDDAVASGGHAVSMSRPTVAGQPHTLSVYAKAGTRGFIRLSLSGGTYYSVFDLNAGTLGLTSGLTSRNIEAVGGGWYRCSITITIAGASVTNTIALMPANQVNPNYAGDGSSLYLWGVQLEQASAASAYTKPAGSEISPLTGVGTASWNATGALPAGIAAASGIGEVTTPPAIGVGVLTTGVADLDAFGNVRSTGSGAGGPATIEISGTSTETDWGNQAFGLHRIGQTFLSVAARIDKIAVPLGRLGSPTDDVVVKVYAVDAQHYPATLLGTSNAVAGMSLADNSTPTVEFTFTPQIAVTNGTEYAWVLERTGALDDSNEFLTRLVDPPTYSGGKAIYYNAGVWGDVGPYDMLCTISQYTVGGLQPASASLSGVGISRIVMTGALVQGAGEITGVGFSGATSTSTLLQARMMPLTLGGGISSSTGGSTRTSEIAIDGARTTYVFGTSPQPRVGQNFVSQGEVLTSVTVYVSKNAAPTDSLRVKIQSVDAAHLPSSALVVQSLYITGSTLPTGAPVARTFTFSTPVYLQKGIEYCVIVERTSSANATNNYNISATTNVYAPASFLYMSTSTWLLDDTRDLVVSISQIEGGLFSARGSINGAGIGPAWVGTGALGPSLPPLPDPITLGATISIDFLKRTGWVQGVGNVGIETLLGNDPNYTSSVTGYDPLGITQWGYNHRKGALQQLPAFIGALRDQVLAGNSVIIKFQSDDQPFGEYEEEFDLDIMNTGNDRWAWVAAQGDYVSSGMYWDFGPELGPGAWFFSPLPGLINSFGLTFHKGQNRFETAANNVMSAGSAILGENNAPAANPMRTVILSAWGAIASITVFNTLSLAELQAQTVQRIYNGDPIPSPIAGVGVAHYVATGAFVTARSIVAGAGLVQHAASGTMPAQIASLAGVGTSSSAGTAALPWITPALPPDAIINVDFLTNKGFVAGTGEVGIETLIGSDPETEWALGPTEYDPAYVTQYGYEPYRKPGEVMPAMIGALKTAALGGKSIVIKFQTPPSPPASNWVNVYLMKSMGFDGPFCEGFPVQSNFGTSKWQQQIGDGAWTARAPGNINALGFNVVGPQATGRMDFAAGNFGSGTHAFSAADWSGPLALAMIITYEAITSITVYETLALPALQAKTARTLQVATGSLNYATMTGLGSAVTGVGGTGAFIPADAIAAGAGISGTYGGTGVLTSNASLAGVGKVIATGSGALVVPGVAAMAGVGVVRAVGTAALNAQAAVAVGAGIARHVATGTMPSTYATLAAAGSVVAGPEGTGTFVAQVAKVVASGVAHHIATGALVDQVASITSTGNVRWSGTGAMPAGVAAVAGAGVSSSSVTAASLLAARSQVEGWEGVAIIAGTGALVAQSHTLASSGGVLTSGTGALLDQASALAGAGLSRSLGTGAPISQASVISGAGVSSVAGAGAIIPTTAAVVSGAGIIIPAPSGTGALSSGVSRVTAFGVVERVMTGVLVAQNRVMSSTGGVSRTVGTGAILGTEAAAAGVAVGTSRGTGALVTVSTLAGAGVSRVEGAGALSSGVAAVAGTAVATQLGNGALTASSAAVSGAGFVQHVVVSAALAAQAAQVTAGGLSSSTATAPLQASRSTVQGVQGVMIGLGVGDLQAQSRLMAGAGLVRAIGTGSLSVADSSTVNAVGESDSSGSGVLGCSPSIIEATGKGDIEGTGELEAAGAVLASTGGSVRWAGTGELEAQDRKVVGIGRAIATGTGALQLPTVATVTGTGTTSSRGFGNMTSKRATIYGTAFLSTLGSGELQAQNRKLTGVGRVIATGTGILRQARPDLDGEGLSFSRGTGQIKPRSAQIHAFGVETAYGEGDLVSLPVTISGSNLIEGDAVIDAASAQIVGVGEVGAYIPAAPPDPPGSYPGTTTWAGYTRTPSQLPPPWWMRKAA
jgi:hypothetical protein